MTQFFFPFTSISGDRQYNAKDFATYFHSIFTDGVIATVKDKLRVSQNEQVGMQVVVNTGAAFIHGHLYLLSEPIILNVTPGSSTSDRVDSIVLQLDHLERNMKILYKQGTTSVRRDENYWELQLATIDVPRNATQVWNRQINDTRADKSVGGYSKLQGELDVEGMEQHYESLLQQLSTDMAQWVTGKKVDFQGDWDAWFTTTQNTLDQLVTNMQSWSTDKQAEFETDWNTWFATVQGALEGDTAGELLSMITQLQTDLGNIDAPTTQEFEQLEADAAAHQADDATTSKKGHVQLSDATDSTSQTLAATPNAVKQAYDRANEAFTSASNGKQLVGNAITGVDDSVVIPTNPTFEDLASAIGGISAGAKRAEGSGSVEQHVDLEVIGLGFKPAVVVIKWQYGVGVGTLKYNSDSYWEDAGSVTHSRPWLRVRDVLDDGFVVRNNGTGSYTIFDWIAYDE